MQNERRSGDIGEQHQHRRGISRQKSDIFRISEHLAVGGEGRQHAARRTPCNRQRFAHLRTQDRQRRTDEQQQNERPLPRGEIQQHTAHDGCHDRSDAVDGRNHGNEPGELVAGIHIRSNRTGEYDTSGSRKSLEQAQEIEQIDIRRDDTERRRHDEGCHRNQQRHPPAVTVADRTDEDLSDGQAEHAGRQAHLCHRRRRTEIIGQRRKRRQVEIGDERPECRKQAERHEKKRVIFVVAIHSLSYLETIDHIHKKNMQHSSQPDLRDEHNMLFCGANITLFFGIAASGPDRFAHWPRPRHRQSFPYGKRCQRHIFFPADERHSVPATQAAAKPSRPAPKRPTTHAGGGRSRTCTENEKARLSPVVPPCSSGDP